MKKGNLPYFLDFPEDFYKDAVNTIFKTAERGQNLQLIAPKGSGKSLLFRAISKNKKYYIYNFDINLMTDRSYRSLYKMISEKVDIKKIGQDGVRTIFLFDSFDSLSEKDDKLLIKSLLALYDQNRDFLSFVFALEKPIGFNAGISAIYNLYPLTFTDAKWFVKGVEEALNGKKMNTKTLNQIYKASGGHMATIKRLTEIYSAGENVEDFIKNPNLSPHLTYQMELLIECDFDGDNQVFKNYIANKKGLQRPEDGLTASEYKLFEILNKNKGEIVNREDLIQAVWGQNATRGISDHALDQLVHRLKNKTKGQGINIVTVRGRGVKIT